MLHLQSLDAAFAELPKDEGLTTITGRDPADEVRAAAVGVDADPGPR